MIDAYTRYTASVFTTKKTLETIVDNMMTTWVANYGRPKKCWSDVGGEFNNDTVQQLGEAIKCKMETEAGYAAWQKSLNERNHAVVNRCFGKILLDTPKMNPKIALAWALTAKNSHPTYGGFSSFQLVFWKQPNLPNIMTNKLPALEATTTSQSVAAHIIPIYAGRQAFAETMCDEKVRKALRHKVRAVERIYAKEEQVCFKQDGDKATWRGPGQILGKRGSMYFIVHQAKVVRVTACRIFAVAEASRQMGESG